jgi:hypothetical protein
VPFACRTDARKVQISQELTVGRGAHNPYEGNPYEAIKMFEAWEPGFNLGNAVK